VVGVLGFGGWGVGGGGGGGGTLLQVKMHITVHTVPARSHIYMCSQCRGRSNHEPLQGNALTLHEVAKEKKECENWRRN